LLKKKRLMMFERLLTDYAQHSVSKWQNMMIGETVKSRKQFKDLQDQYSSVVVFDFSLKIIHT